MANLYKKSNMNVLLIIFNSNTYPIGFFQQKLKNPPNLIKLMLKAKNPPFHKKYRKADNYLN